MTERRIPTRQGPLNWPFLLSCIPDRGIVKNDPSKAAPARRRAIPIEDDQPAPAPAAAWPFPRKIVLKLGKPPKKPPEGIEEARW